MDAAPARLQVIRVLDGPSEMRLNTNRGVYRIVSCVSQGARPDGGRRCEPVAVCRCGSLVASSGQPSSVQAVPIARE